MSSRRPRFALPLFVALLWSAALAVPRAGAVDGVVLIDQSKVAVNGGFPYKITIPGSYRLSSNLTLAAGADAIDVSASPVTVDLNGFTISGVNPTTFTAINGLSAGQLTVRNGSIQGFNMAIETKGSLKAGDLFIQNATFGAVPHLTGDLSHLVVNAILDGVLCLADCRVSESSINAEFALTSNSGSMVALNNNLVVSQSGVSAFYGLALQNSIAATAGSAIVGVFGLSASSIIAYGANQIITNFGGVCAKGGTVVSMGDNVCNGVRQ
jgi:hypothetical protein